MTIDGKVHCFFEQSGTFKNEFKKLGYEAYDYDIQNNFGQTDYVIDLFSEIDNAYEGNCSIFDSIKKDDIIIAFYPCIYFCAMSQVLFSFGAKNYRRLSIRQKTEKILERDRNRMEYYERLIKFCTVCIEGGVRMIFENPWSEQTYMKSNFVKSPDIVDMDRTQRGDHFRKPTAYWFWNCNPTHGYFTHQNDKERKRILWQKPSENAGTCSEDRSLISPDYARNFIKDFILGIGDRETDGTLFECLDLYGNE